MAGPNQLTQNSNLSTQEDWNLVSKITAYFGEGVSLSLSQEKILSLLYEGHPGICKINSLVHNFVWWPKIDADLEAKVKQHNQCQLSRPSSPVVPMHPWDWPELPWQCIHLDYVGPIKGKIFLIVTDAHSKWMKAETVNSATLQATIECLTMIFTRFGLPEVMVSDNGTCFTSFKNLHNAIISDMYALPLIQMAWQKGQCRL